jgi:hypothetical protein
VLNISRRKTSGEPAHINPATIPLDKELVVLVTI